MFPWVKGNVFIVVVVVDVIFIVNSIVVLQ